MAVSRVENRSTARKVVLAAGFVGLSVLLAGGQSLAMSAEAKPATTPTAPTDSNSPAAPASSYSQSEYQEPVNGPAVPADSPISVLGSAEGNTVGLLGGASDLGDDLWAATPRGTVVSLLQTGTLSTTDPALRDLSKRIVLTKADAPNGVSKHALITERIQQLINGGLLDEAGTLAARSTLPDDTDFARVQADALLYAGRAADACSDLTATRFSSADLYWIELRAYCAVAAGDSVLSELSMAALDAQGGDQAFKILLDNIANQKLIQPQVYTNPTALQMFMLKKLDLPLPPIFAEKGGIPENMALAADKRVSADVRTLAAERILRSGALPMATLRDVAAARTLSMTELSNAEILAPKVSLFSALSLLRRTAEVEIRPDRKEKLIEVALQLAAKDNQLPLAAAFLSDHLANMVPVSPDDPTIIARALLLNDNERSANRWLMWDASLHAAALLLSSERANENMLQSTLMRYADAITAPGAKGDSRKALIVGMAAILGRLSIDVPDLAAPAYASQYEGKRPDTAAMAQLTAAAATPGRKGEALLLILTQIKSIGWRNLAPDASIRFVRLLRTLGYGPAAQSFAREALLLYDPPAPVVAPVAPHTPAPPVR